MRAYRLVISMFLAVAWCAATAHAGLPNPFYAMDTCTKRPYPQNDLPPAAQLDLLKEIGYNGIAWTEEPPEQVKAVVAEAEARGLKMYAIYYGATVSAEGDLKVSPQLDAVMEVLRGHDTLIWVHIDGKGPNIAELKADSPVIVHLRELAEKAARQGLRVAIYPHVGNWTERVHDAVQVAKLVDRPDFGITFNLCHCLAKGDEERIPALLEEAAPYLFTVTINGADSGIGKPDWSHLIQALDKGTYDVTIVLRALKQLRFQGPIGLQGYGVGGDRRENLERSMQAWRALSAAAAKPKPAP